MAGLGVFGGAFDPVHGGHVAIAACAKQALGLGRMLVVPSGNPPHKSHLVGAEHRLAMVRLAFAGTGCRVSDIEMRPGATGYSVDTLRGLRQANPRTPLWFVVGEDNLAQLPTWRDLPGIGQLCGIAVALRPGSGGPTPEAIKTAHEAGVRVVFLPLVGPDISSTQLRRELAAGNDVGRWCGPQVAAYIREHGLYRA